MHKDDLGSSSLSTYGLVEMIVLTSVDAQQKGSVGYYTNMTSVWGFHQE